jgi:hypothetical protein
VVEYLRVFGHAGFFFTWNLGSVAATSAGQMNDPVSTMAQWSGSRE